MYLTLGKKTETLSLNVTSTRLHNTTKNTISHIISHNPQKIKCQNLLEQLPETYHFPYFVTGFVLLYGCACGGFADDII